MAWVAPLLTCVPPELGTSNSCVTPVSPCHNFFTSYLGVIPPSRWGSLRRELHSTWLTGPYLGTPVLPKVGVTASS